MAAAVAVMGATKERMIVIIMSLTILCTSATASGDGLPPVHPRVDAIVKIFDATNPINAFCKGDSPFSGSTTLSSLSELGPAAEISLPTIIKSITGQALASAMHAAVVAMVQEIDPTEEPSSELEKWLVQLRESEDGGHEMISDWTTKVLSDAGLAPLYELIQRASAQKAAKADGGDSNVDGVDERGPASLLEVLTSQMLAALVDCVVADNGMNPLDLKEMVYVAATHTGLGECICKSMSIGFSRGDVRQQGCGMLDMIIAGLACPSSIDTTCPETAPDFTKIGFEKCDLPPPTGSTSTDPNADYDLYLKPFDEVQVAGSIPQLLPNTIHAEEGLTYYYLFRASTMAMMFSTASLCDTYPIPSLVPGWTSELVINAVEEGEESIERHGSGSLPLAIVSRRGCDVLITIRGTMNPFEWRMNFTYNQIFGNLTAVGTGQDYPNGLQHHGFTAMAAAIVPSFATYYATLADQCTTAATPPRLLVTGHSLGGGVSTALSMLLASLYPDVPVSSVLFAPPSLFDPSSVAAFNKRVNVRSLKADLDPVPSVPCSISDSPTGTMLCPKGAVGIGPASEMPLYEKTAGEIMIHSSDLLAMSGEPRWNSTNLASLGFEKGVGGGQSYLKGVVLEAASVQLAAYHACAYSCFTGQYCTSDKSKQWACSGQDSPTVPNIVKCPFMGMTVKLPFP